MAIIDIYLTDTEGSFEADDSETTLEWVVYSDVILDYAQRIVAQGMIPPGAPLIVRGKAQGWYPFGTAYRLGNDVKSDIFAKRVEVFDRKIIRGRGDFLIQNLAIVEIFDPENPIVQWRVRQTFTTDPKNDEPKPQEELSEDDKFTISVSYEWEDAPFHTDVVTGQPIKNSAGMSFNPPAYRRRKLPVISLTRKEYGNPVDKALAFSNTVDGIFLIDTIITQFDGKIWTVTYNLKTRPEGWTTQIMDTGYYWRDPQTGRRFPIIGDDGLPVSEPARLNGNGLRVTFDSDEVHNVGPFHRYPISPLLALKIPDPRKIMAIPPPIAG